jgi:di/tricarboxylate transporter
VTEVRSFLARRGLIVLAVVALALCLFLPPLFPGLPARGQRALAVTLITIILWTTRGLDSGATSLLGVALLGLTGAAGGFRPALVGFANPVPYFLIGVLAMGVAVAKSGLAERLARRILAHARGRALRVYVQLVLAMPVLTFLLPSATTTIPCRAPRRWSSTSAATSRAARSCASACG